MEPLKQHTYLSMLHWQMTLHEFSQKTGLSLSDETTVEIWSNLTACLRLLTKIPPEVWAAVNQNVLPDTQETFGNLGQPAAKN